jgi:hypothetical protein
VRWGLDYNQKDKHHSAQMGLGWANHNESKRSNMADEQLKREGMYLDYNKALAADKARGDDAAYKAKLEMLKDNETRGIKIVVDKQPLLTAAGRAKMEQAAKLEEEATKLEEFGKGDPMSFSVKGGKQRMEMLREKASILRGDAQISDVVRARDPNQAGVISKKWAASQTFMQTVDEIDELYDKAGRGLISKDDMQQELKAKYGLLSVAAKDAWQLGAWDKGSKGLVQDIIGMDPTDAWDIGYITSGMIGQSPEGFRNRLKAVTQKLGQDMENELSTNTTWDDKGKLFSRKERLDVDSPMGKAAQKIKGATPVASAEGLAESDDTVGGAIASKVVDSFTVGKGPLSSRDEQARAVEERTGSLKYLGLNKDQAGGFETLLKQYKAGGPAAVKAGEALAAQVINHSQSQPDLAIALARNLNTYAPDLYAKVRVAIPKGKVDEQLSYIENNRIAQAPLETRQVAAFVINTLDARGKVTDQESWKELARRAQSGDKEAKKALLDVASQSSYLGSLPQGSVFREKQ